MKKEIADGEHTNKFVELVIHVGRSKSSFNVAIEPVIPKMTNYERTDDHSYNSHAKM